MCESKHKNEIILKYYVLPLYGVTFSVIKEYYKAIYLKSDGNFMFIALKENELDFRGNPLFQDIVEIEGNKYHVFETAELFKNDIKLLIGGKYSEMSLIAKNKIIQFSGLKYKECTEKGVFTSYPLMALCKFPEWKQTLETALAVKLDKNAELIDKLTKSAFIDNINN
jgi:hypothetical protein